MRAVAWGNVSVSDQGWVGGLRTGGGPGGCAVDFAVGDCDAARGFIAEDDVLAGDEVGGYVIDPDHVACGRG